jgi:DNA (cytosine-5)-methyltransferase 1
VTSRPRLLDLFCGPGGAGTGYHRAGFDVVGVDIEDQPDYPFSFVRGDALEYLEAHGDQFDAVHASPPCTEHSTLTRANPNRNNRTNTAGLLPATLEALAIRPAGMWVVENVMGAVMPTDMVLCGSMFGLRVYRHRRFTIGPGLPLLSLPDHPRHRVPSVRSDHAAAWAAGHNVVATAASHQSIATRALFATALGIDWVRGTNLTLAIPPAYTEYLGAQLLEAVCQLT